MNDKTQEKLRRIQQLLAEKEKIDNELEALLAPEKVVALPPGFSLNSEVYQLIQESGASGIASTNILRALSQKYPDYGIDRKKVASSLAYLKNTKKNITDVARGVYRIVSTEPS